MRAIVLDALRVGALGFSTSRTIGHRAVDGEVVPGTYAAEDELFGIGGALGEAGTGVFELAPLGSAGEHPDDVWTRSTGCAGSRRRSTVPCRSRSCRSTTTPDLWRKQLAESLEACAEGAQLYPQVAGRATGLLTGHFATYLPLLRHPRLRRAARRAASLAAEFGGGPGRPRGSPRRSCRGRRRRPAWPRRWSGRTGGPSSSATRPTTSRDRNARWPAWRRRGACRPWRSPTTRWREDGGTGLLYLPILNYSTGDLDHVYDMLQHPQGLLGLSDGGAHTGTICDGGMPTFMLTHWTRDRRRGATLPLEYIVKKQTHDTARLYGMSDRGTVEPGALADFNLIDYEGLSLGVPFVRADLPAGGRRLLQKAIGIRRHDQEGT